MTSTTSIDTTIDAAEIRYDQLFIDGQWQDPTTGDTIEITSPSTELHVGGVR